MASRLVEKAYLSAKGLLNTARKVFKKVKEPTKGSQGLEKKISITDCLMSALAVFKLKFPSLLQFEESKEEEPIMKEDGSTKNDCERNATERLLRDFRREHPHLPIILVEDALSSNGPHLKLLKELNLSFISVVKPDGNKSLFLD